MKKIVTLFLIVFSLMMIAGCQTNSPLELTVQVVDQSNDVRFEKTIQYSEGAFDGVLEAIESEVLMDYEMSEYGAFIKGVGGIYPTDSSYWYSIYVDDIYSEVGIVELTLEDQMVIEFRETSMKDALALEVDQSIYSFVDQLVEDYISDEKIDYYVFAAYQKLQTFNTRLKTIESLLTKEKIKTDYSVISDLPSAFRSAIYFKALGLNLDLTATYLSGSSVNEGPYAVYSYYPLVLSKYIINQTVDEVHLGQLSSETTISDADYAGMALQLLSLDSDSYDVRINEILTYLKETVTKDGFLDYSGKASASSTAQVVLGLVSLGINPRSFENIDLIEALMSYQVEGGFKNHQTGAVDLMFSTPQVFSSLVVYKLFNDTYQNPKTSLYF